MKPCALYTLTYQKSRPTSLGLFSSASQDDDDERKTKQRLKQQEDNFRRDFRLDALPDFLESFRGGFDQSFRQ